jgi:hypothetical protein
MPKNRHWRPAGFLRLKTAKMEPSPTHTLNRKTRRNGPFRAHSVSDIYGEQPHLGLFGAHCSREQKDLCGSSLFSPELTGTKICVPEKAKEELGKRLFG